MTLLPMLAAQAVTSLNAGTTSLGMATGLNNILPNTLPQVTVSTFNPGGRRRRRHTQQVIRISCIFNHKIILLTVEEWPVENLYP